jgi:hypothetical protein
MTQVARRASLVVVLLLGSVAMAFAEGKWVLWSNAEVMKPSKRFNEARGWRVEDAFASQPECVAAMRKKFMEQVARTTPNTGHLDAESYRILTFGGEASFNGRCLPDTVDPRAPKGK